MARLHRHPETDESTHTLGTHDVVEHLELVGAPRALLLVGRVLALLLGSGLRLAVGLGLGGGRGRLGRLGAGHCYWVQVERREEYGCVERLGAMSRVVRA